MDGIRVLVDREPWQEGIGVLIAEVKAGKVSYATSIIMEEKKEGEHIDPTFRLSLLEAQELIDGLWSCGLRPSEGSGSAGQLAATQKHLEDMRSIAFNQLGIQK